MKKPTKEQLMQDVSDNLSWKQIAEKYNYSSDRFLRRAYKNYGLPPRRKILKPTKEQLIKMLENSNITNLYKELGYTDPSTLYQYCRDYGINVDFRGNYKMREADITNKQKKLIYGTLLGDGYINPHGSLSLCQGENQIGYLMFKANILDNFIKTKTPYKHTHKTDKLIKKETITYSLNTISIPFLKELKELCYPNGKKTVSKEWLENIDEFALMFWFLDDGSYNRTYHTITLCTNAFTYEEQLLIQNWFLEKWNIPIVICKVKGRLNQYTLRINSKYSNNFINLFKGYVPKCMEYKIGVS